MPVALGRRFGAADVSERPGEGRSLRAARALRAAEAAKSWEPASDIHIYIYMYIYVSVYIYIYICSNYRFGNCGNFYVP